MQISMARQSEYYDHRPYDSHTSCDYSQCLISNDEIKLEKIKCTTKSRIFDLDIPLPVYVRTVDGIEEVAYNSKVMKTDKPYRVTWNGEEFIVKKSDDYVDFYKFVPEK